MRALLALNNASYPFSSQKEILDQKKPNQIWDEDQSTFEVFLVLFFRSVYTLCESELTPLTHVN